jgi:hypothetical protein
MARALGFLLVLMAAGCTDGDAPPILVSDAGADLSATTGSACTTACDCPAGEACQQGTCQQLQQMVFCCGTAACTGAAVCQFPDGTVSQCDRPDGGVAPVIDGGTTPAMCAMTSCTMGLGGDTFCKLACGSLGATCVKGAGGNDHCSP